MPTCRTDAPCPYSTGSRRRGRSRARAAVPACPLHHTITNLSESRQQGSHRLPRQPQLSARRRDSISIRVRAARRPRPPIRIAGRWQGGELQRVLLRRRCAAFPALAPPISVAGWADSAKRAHLTPGRRRCDPTRSATRRPGVSHGSPLSSSAAPLARHGWARGRGQGPRGPRGTAELEAGVVRFCVRRSDALGGAPAPQRASQRTPRPARAGTLTLRT